jgi:phage virion morphogenesis protein
MNSNLNKIRQRFLLLQQKCDNLEPVLNDIGQEVINHTYTSFNEQKDPVTGINWKPLNELTIYNQHRGKKKLKNGKDSASYERFVKNKKILRFRNRLFQSISYTTGKSYVAIGSNLPYALVHQYGNENIPKRRYLPFKDNDTDVSNDLSKDILNIINEHLKY